MKFYQWPITIVLALLSPVWAPLVIFGFLFSVTDFHEMVWNKNG